MNTVNMDQIMMASFGENSSTVRASFKKTINVKQYETEIFEASTTLEVGRVLTGVERMIISLTLQAQLEYEGYIQLCCKGYVTQTQLEERKKYLEQSVNLIKQKGEVLLGKPVDYLFELVSEANKGSND